MKVKKARKKFVDFTKNLWIQEITQEETGTLLNQKLQEVLELDRLYLTIKNKYDILYKEFNIEKNKTSIIVITIILLLSLIFNILNYVALIR